MNEAVLREAGNLRLELSSLKSNRERVGSQVEVEKGPERRRYWLLEIASALLFGIFAVVVTWPLVRELDDRVVMGTEVARTVPLFNAWTIWWNVDRVEHGLEDYWDAPIFLPVGNTFALSEPQPITMLMAPVYWMTGSVFRVANIYLLISLALNGWVTYRWLRWLDWRWLTALGGGAAMLLLPIVHWQIGVQQLVPIWGVVWTWFAFYRWTLELRGPGVGAKEELRVLPGRGWYLPVVRAAELGLAFSCTMFTCAHHGLFLALVMITALPIVGRDWFRLRTWGSGLLAAIVVVVLTGPVVWQLRSMPVEISRRPDEVIRNLSLPINDYGAVYGHTVLDFGHSWARDGWMASPGWLKLGWAAVGIVFGFMGSAHRRWTVMLVLVGIASFVLSLGPRFSLGQWEPWWWIRDWVPGFAEVRNVFRFAYFVQMVVVLLAAIGVEGTITWLSRQTRSVKWGMGAILISFALWGVADPWPPRTTLVYATNMMAHEDWGAWLRQDHEDLSAFAPGQRLGVLCLPMAGGDGVRDFEVTADWMMLTVLHGVPLKNGYSGFFPSDYYRLRDEVHRENFSNGVMNQLWADGVRWIVVDTLRHPAPWESETRAGDVRLQRVFTGKQQIVIFRLSRAE